VKLEKQKKEVPIKINAAWNSLWPLYRLSYSSQTIN